MASNDARYLALLKKRIVMVFKESYPHASDSISDWKGQMIYQFQEDLMEKVQDQVSEKWFYTHMKKGSSRLPRLDILNMLSRYAGFDSWDDFKYRTDLPVDPADRNRSGRVFIIVPLVVAGLLLVLWAGFKLFSTRNYTLCFASRDDPSMAVSDTRVEILQDHESPMIMNSSHDGCIELRTDAIKLRMVVSAPFFKTDTITRTLKKFSRSETILLVPDDYTLMLNYFFHNDTDAWQKRRDQLDMMFADSARIFEVYKHGTIGLQLYDKWEFINKLSVPTKSNQGIDILDTRYEGDKITSLRFTIDVK